MQKTLLLFVSVLFPIFLFAQNGTIRGTVYEKDGSAKAISATISLIPQSSSQGANRAQKTNQSGVFEFEKLASGTYRIQISLLGHQTYTKGNITITKDQKLDLGNIFLEEEGNEIAEVVVQAKVPELQIGIDKKVFDVSQSIVSAGGSAQDLLGNVPTLQVESDGGISLRGSSSVRILIDGKESAMAGSDINAFLQSLPAEAIDKVEIITNPSARYDAEGQSGIINIVLKKNARLGLNGSVNASVGNYANANAGVTLNYRPGKVNYFGSYNFGRRNSKGDGFNDNTEYIDGKVSNLSPRTRNEDVSSRLGYNHTVRLGTDYYINDKNTLGLATNFSIRDNERGQEINYQYWNIPEYGANSFRNSSQQEQDFGIDAQVDYKHTFAREGEELMANVSFGYDTEDGTNDYHQTFASGIADLRRQNETSELGKNWNFQLDYTLPLGEDHKFEAGYRSMLRYADESQYSELLDTISNQYMPDYTVSNDFDMSSAVHALYVNYQRKLTDRLGAQFGLRAEQAYLNTTIYSYDKDAPSHPILSDGKLDYFRLYPSVFLSYGVGESKNDKIQLSYSRRVQRPRGWQVNPFIDMSDEQNFMQGNPNLLPEDIHAMELGFAKFYEKWNFVASAFYRRVNDQTQPVIYDASLIADIVGDRANVNYSKWENAADMDALGFELITKLNLTNWWDITGNLNLSSIKFDPKPGLGLQGRESFNWNGNLSSNLKFTPTFSAQVRGNYRSGMKTMQGRMEAMKGMDIALKKEVLKNKGTITLNARDVFNSRKFEMQTFLPDRQMHFSHRWRRRMITLSFSYRFGIQDLNKKERSEPEDGGDMEGPQY